MKNRPFLASSALQSLQHGTHETNRQQPGGARSAQTTIRGYLTLMLTVRTARRVTSLVHASPRLIMHSLPPKSCHSHALASSRLDSSRMHHTACLQQSAAWNAWATQSYVHREERARQRTMCGVRQSKTESKVPLPTVGLRLLLCLVLLPWRRTL